jgi:hypothetical protein
MTSQDDFTNDEWNLLMKAPDAAATAVMAANPDGAVKEREVFFEAWDKSYEQPFADSQIVLALIRNRDALGEERRLQASYEETLSSVSFDQARAVAIDMCQKAVVLLKQKATPQEIEDYKRWVMYLCERVAEAVKQGGFLRLGGHKISDKEQAILDEVSAALQ